MVSKGGLTGGDPLVRTTPDPQMWSWRWASEVRSRQTGRRRCHDIPFLSIRAPTPTLLYCGSSPDKRAVVCLKESQELQPMPKLKTHKGAAKRFKKTGTGKVVRHHAFARHILSSKARSRKRRLVKGVVVDPSNAPRVKEMLPY